MTMSLGSEQSYWIKSSVFAENPYYKKRRPKLYRYSLAKYEPRQLAELLGKRGRESSFDNNAEQRMHGKLSDRCQNLVPCAGARCRALLK
jgi:hypothetical protein